MSRFSESFISIFFYVLFIYGEIFGIYHSVKHHSGGDVIASISIPPWAWYRSAEMWWHEEFSEEEWSQKLSNDIEVCIYFVSKSFSEETDKFDYNSRIEKFSKKIRKYPDDKIDYLKKGTRLYINYLQSMQNDMKTTWQRYIDFGNWEYTPSQKTSDFQIELGDYISSGKIDKINSDTKDLIKTLSRVIQEKGLSQEIKDSFIERFNSKQKLNDSLMEDAYLKIFID